MCLSLPASSSYLQAWQKLVLRASSILPKATQALNQWTPKDTTAFISNMCPRHWAGCWKTVTNKTDMVPVYMEPVAQLERQLNKGSNTAALNSGCTLEFLGIFFKNANILVLSSLGKLNQNLEVRTVRHFLNFPGDSNGNQDWEPLTQELHNFLFDNTI